MKAVVFCIALCVWLFKSPADVGAVMPSHQSIIVQQHLSCNDQPKLTFTQQMMVARSIPNQEQPGCFVMEEEGTDDQLSNPKKRWVQANIEWYYYFLPLGLEHRPTNAQPPAWLAIRRYIFQQVLKV